VKLEDAAGLELVEARALQAVETVGVFVGGQPFPHDPGHGEAHGGFDRNGGQPEA
jgi:hypothetical protein